MICSGNPRKFRELRLIAIFLVLILGTLACRPSAEQEVLPWNSDSQTATAYQSADGATPTIHVKPSATSYTPPSPTPHPPTAAAQPLRTQISMVGPSAAALFLRDRSTASTPRAASEPTSILFVSRRDGVADIYRMKEDGSEQVRLTQNGRNNESPTWAPDGQKIAFLSHEVVAASHTAISHLFVMDADGSGSIDITPELDQSVESPTWSPNGQWIAFVANPMLPEGDFDGYSIYVVNRDGSGLAQIINIGPGSIGCWSPTWSPDSSRLAFVCRGLMSVVIGIADADGSDRWADEYGQVSRVFWLPSGEHVGFDGGICWSVGIFAAEYLLTHGASGAGPWPCLDQDFEVLGVDMTSPYGVAWSPRVDTLFAVQSSDTIQIVDLARYEVIVSQFRSDRLSGSPSWSPHGDHVVFAADDGTDTEIYVLSLESSDLVQLTDNDVDDYMPAWRP
ncbi:MAG: hypothetical protein GTO14_08540 [Anaerolineales bacterium]|nr:hypothetical protein [Anaerolineales bacterium]